MSYKQKNRIRGISYGPSGSYETPSPIKVNWEHLRYHPSDVAGSSSVQNSGADGDDDPTVDNNPVSADDQTTSNPAGDDLDRALEQNIKDGSQQRKIKKLTKDSKDATLSPRKRRRAQEKLKKKQAKYKTKEGFQQGLKEIRSDSQQEKIDKYQKKKIDQLRKRSGLSKDEREALETGTEEKAPGVNFPEKNKYDYMFDFANKMVKDKTINIIPDDEMDKPVIEQFSDDEFKKAKASYDAEVKRKQDERYKASDAAYWEGQFNPSNNMEDPFYTKRGPQPQMNTNMKQIKSKGHSIPYIDPLANDPTYSKPNRAGRSPESNTLTNTPLNITDPNQQGYRDPSKISNQRMQNENFISDLASDQGQVFKSGDDPNAAVIAKNDPGKGVNPNAAGATFTPNTPNAGIDQTFVGGQDGVAQYEKKQKAVGTPEGKRVKVGTRTDGTKEYYYGDEQISKAKYDNLMNSGSTGMYEGPSKRLNIKKAIKKPGQLHRDLGVPEDEKIPKSKIREAAKEKGKVGQRARFALTLEKLRKKKGKK